jgi:branched-chain amino acid transport system ATP-binding protein
LTEVPREELVDRVAGCLGSVLVLITVLAVVGAPVVAGLFAPGFLLNDPARYALTSEMIRIAAAHKPHMVTLVPEGRRVFPELSVERNLEVGGWSRRRDRGWLGESKARVFGYFPRLEERRTQLAGTLSGGEQQMLAIGRGLMARPRLLLIDEASLGLAPVIVKDVFEIIRQINADGTTVVLVEQNVAALDIADVGLVMEQGSLIMQVRGEELRDPVRVRKALMG